MLHTNDRDQRLDDAIDVELDVLSWTPVRLFSAGMHDTDRPLDSRHAHLNASLDPETRVTLIQTRVLSPRLASRLQNTSLVLADVCPFTTTRVLVFRLVFR